MAKTRRNIWRILVLLSILTMAMIYFFAPNTLNFKQKKLKVASTANVKKECQKILPYLQQNNFSTQLTLLFDLKLNLHSKRLYVCNPSSGQILHTFIASHGKGKNSTKSKANTSNIPGSLCTSLGKYRIAERYKGIWGYSYRLDGLDTTNNNARKRAIVLHYYDKQSSNENIGLHFFSEGCPMLAKQDWEILDTLIQQQEQNVLLYIYK